MNDNPRVTTPFRKKPQAEKEKIILMALVKNPTKAFKELSEEYDFTTQEYLDTITASPTFAQELVERAIAEIVLPAVPGVLLTLTEKAIKGDTVMMKHYLTLVNALKPDETTVNVYANASDTELRIQLQQAMEELDAIDGS